MRASQRPRRRPAIEVGDDGRGLVPAPMRRLVERQTRSEVKIQRHRHLRPAMSATALARRTPRPSPSARGPQPLGATPASPASIGRVAPALGVPISPQRGGSGKAPRLRGRQRRPSAVGADSVAMIWRLEQGGRGRCLRCSNEFRPCRPTIGPRSLPSAVARVPMSSAVTTAGRPERQCAARRLGRRRRALWWRSRRMRSRSPSAAHFSVPGSGAVWGSWRHRGWDQVQRLRNRHQIELGPRQRGVSRA
jgi:hypothetical protein